MTMDVVVEMIIGTRTHRLPLAEVERAVKILRAQDEPVSMSVINP
jgi:hypothetical protein